MTDTQKSARGRLGRASAVSAVLALAAAGIVAGTGTSYAGTVTPQSDGGVYTTTGGGYASWTENGDTLSVCDIAGDGHGVRGYIYEPSSAGSSGGHVLIMGNDPESTDGCHAFYKNISETVAISLKVCEYQGTVVNDCDWVELR